MCGMTNFGKAPQLCKIMRGHNRMIPGSLTCISFFNESVCVYFVQSSTVTTKTTRMTTEATTRVTRPRPKTSHKRIIKPCIEIVSRAKWTASKPSQPCYGICHRIPRVIIHHTDTGRCTDLQTCSTIVKSIQNYHMVTEGNETLYYYLYYAKGNTSYYTKLK